VLSLDDVGCGKCLVNVVINDVALIIIAVIIFSNLGSRFS
jgi:hypothetical protein